MARLYNLARMTTATVGTGPITLGAAVPGFLPFSGANGAGVPDQAFISYAIRDGLNSEIGTGTYTLGSATLTRTVRKSTNANAAISLSGTAEVFITPSAEDLDDTTTVLGNAGSYYNPTFFGNPGTGVIHRFNRVLVGGAALGSSDAPQTTKDYIQSITGFAGFSDAQLSSLSAIGSPGVFGATRTSDFFAWSGTHTGGVGAVQGFGINDDAGGGNPIALGGLFVGVMRAGPTSGITLGAQLDINTVISPFTPTVVSGLLGGSSVALVLTPGAYASVSTKNASAGAYFGAGNATNNTVFRKGILFANNSLDTTVGAGTGGLAIELFRGQSLRWQNSTPTTDTEIWGNASGLTINSALVVAGAINKVTITTPATGSTLTIADGKTATVNNSLTFAGTDVTTMTFPTTSASIARTDAAQTFTGTQTITGSAAFFNALIATSTENSANTGPYAVLYRNRTGQANDALGAFGWQANSSAGTQRNVGFIQATWQSPTDGAENGAYVFQTIQGGTLATRALLGNGLAIGSVTDPGSGNLNVGGKASFGLGSAPSHYVQIGGGTTAIAPILLTSGTNLTAALAGAIEYDGKCIYGTTVASTRQVVDTEQFTTVQGSAVSLSNSSTSPQNIFASGGQVISLAAATTYYFEGFFDFSTGNTTHTTALGLVASSAFTSILYVAELWSVTNQSISTTAPSITDVNTSAATVLNATSTATGTLIRVKGVVRTNAASTLTPQITFSSGPTGTCQTNINSWFRIWPVGVNTVQAVGNWA